MVAGIVYLALGLKKVIEYVADTEHHHLTDPLPGSPCCRRTGGVALYLLAHLAFRLRNIGPSTGSDSSPPVLLVALVPVACALPALASLGLLAAVLVALIGYEVTVHAEARRAIRHAGHGH